jgi:hypothetical protein
MARDGAGAGERGSGMVWIEEGDEEEQIFASQIDATKSDRIVNISIA